MRKSRQSEIDRFIALPDAEKERIARELENESAQHLFDRSRPLSAEERKRWRRFKARRGGSQTGKGAKTVSLTMEKELLERADAYARQHGITRSKLVAQGLQVILGSAA